MEEGWKERGRRWYSGSIRPCHGRDPGSIPGRRIDFDSFLIGFVNYVLIFFSFFSVFFTWLDVGSLNRDHCF